MKKKDLPCIIVMSVIALGMIVESVGAVMSRTTAIGRSEEHTSELQSHA
mgnify:CR=1 FL=1